jgi:ATP-dependent RNA helicase DeaD
MDFNGLDITEEMRRAISRMGFDEMTPVQSASIEPMMRGDDIVVTAATGSGKTAAFGIPVIENVDVDNPAVQVLIVCPTRELALQIVEVFHELSMYKHGVRTLAVYGGENIEMQIKGLKRKPQIIVATPGRLVDHINRRTIRLGNLTTVVLDEADRMLDMGFKYDMDAILRAAPSERQTVMFSATMSKDVMKIANKYQKNAARISIDSDLKAVNTVSQYLVESEVRDKEARLVKLLNDERYEIALVFVSRKHLAKNLARLLKDNHFHAEALQGNMSQPQRTRVMNDFKNGRVKVLVATDVAARGIDVDDIDVVINYDLPQEPDSYVHRVGRTGRAGKSGDAYTLVSPNEARDFAKIIQQTKSGIKIVEVAKDETFVPRKKMPANLPKSFESRPGERRHGRPDSKSSGKAGKPSGKKTFGGQHSGQKNSNNSRSRHK